MGVVLKCLFLLGEVTKALHAAMETVEEGNNQPVNTPKRIKVEEIVAEEEEEDRISALPDGLLLEILSRLPSTISAIRTGTLSKRWKYLWTWVSTLIFEHHDGIRSLSDFVSFVDKTLTQCRQLKLRKFVVSFEYDTQFEAQVNNWISYAISCHVEELYLIVGNLDLEAVFPLNESFFINSCFTYLKLQACIFNPNWEISWKNVRSLHIHLGYLDEGVIENILSGSPRLETLVFNTCYGYRRIDITSKSVKNLVFVGYNDPDDLSNDLADIIEINAPNIVSLKILSYLLLWKLLLLDVSSLVEAELDYTKSYGYCETTHKEEEDVLKGFIQSLRHVKELKIGLSCAKVIVRLLAKGFIFPSNVKFSDGMFSDSDSDGQGDWFDSDSDERRDGEVFPLDHGCNS